MNRLIAAFGIALIATASLAADSHAGWKNRGWYSPRVVCQMKRVTIRKHGTVIIRQIRVCR